MQFFKRSLRYCDCIISTWD